MCVWHAKYDILVSIPEIEHVRHNYGILVSDMCVYAHVCMWLLDHLHMSKMFKAYMKIIVIDEECNILW